MNSATLNEIVSWFHATHQDILQLVDELPDEELVWRPVPLANSIAFYLWHLARWADYIPSSLSDATPGLAKRLGPRPQIWHQEHLATQWHLDPTALGEEETGWELDPSLAGHLQLPGKDVLLGYARRAFAATEQALPALDDEQFPIQRQQEWATNTVGHFILQHLCHENEHLGMMRYLHGLYQLGIAASREKA
jgi:hypothetical protein